MKKIRELKKEISNEMKESWGCGRSPFEILTDILSLMEDDYTTMKSSSPEQCCEDYETCEKTCVPRVDYFKENSRVELNKLALSILKESLKDKKYRESWEFKIEAALYEAVLKRSGDLIKSENMYSRYGNDMAKVFMDRLFGGIE